MSNRKGLSKKQRRNSQKTRYKYFFLFTTILIAFIFFLGFSYFTKPFTSNLINKKKPPAIKKSSQKTVIESPRSKKDFYNEQEFTFFTLLTKTEKQNLSESSKSRNQENLEPLSPVKTDLAAPHNKNSIRYIIQVASFKDKPAAKNLKNKLAKKGYQVSIETANIPDKGLWYRVSLAGFDDKESALKLLKKIKSEDNLSAFLKRTNYEKTKHEVD